MLLLCNKYVLIKNRAAAAEPRTTASKKLSELNFKNPHVIS